MAPSAKLEQHAKEQRWARPANAERGPRSPDAIYRAVGVAVSAWETLQLNLPRLLGIFWSMPAQRAIVQDDYAYAESHHGRIQIVKVASEKFFCTFCHQDLEGRLSALLHEIDRASRRRNDLAHGVIGVLKVSRWHSGHDEYAWFPPTHRAAEYEDDGFPAFAYNSAMILALANGFQSLDRPTLGLCRDIARLRAAIPTSQVAL